MGEGRGGGGGEGGGGRESEGGREGGREREIASKVSENNSHLNNLI